VDPFDAVLEALLFPLDLVKLLLPLLVIISLPSKESPRKLTMEECAKDKATGGFEEEVVQEMFSSSIVTLLCTLNEPWKACSVVPSEAL
jgi:hypothetical protein